jgi:hypothetical protein
MVKTATKPKKKAPPKRSSVAAAKKTAVRKGGARGGARSASGSAKNPSGGRKRAAEVTVQPEPSTGVDLSLVESLLGIMEKQILPGVEEVAQGAAAIIGPGCAQQIGRSSVAMQTKSREAIFFFTQASKAKGPEADLEREMLEGHGVARLAEALALQSSLNVDLATQVMFKVMTPVGVPMDKMRQFNIGGPAYFPKVIHTLGTIMRAKLGVPAADWEVMLSAFIFALANMDQFCSEPYIAKRFGLAANSRRVGEVARMAVAPVKS